jgi:hypothetical protein
MPLHRVIVECYAGARADERPRRIIIRGREHFVTSLLAEFVEESAATKGQIRRYKVLTDEGLVFDVRRDSDGVWYLESERRASRE